MHVEVSIDIAAPVGKVWQTLTELDRWKRWNSVLRQVSTFGSPHLVEGTQFRCSVRVLPVPTFFDATVVEVDRYGKVVWVSDWLGIRARHAFLCRPQGDGTVRVTSRERFSGFTTAMLGPLFPSWRVQQLTRALLRDLKAASEQ